MIQNYECVEETGGLRCRTLAYHPEFGAVYSERYTEKGRLEMSLRRYPLVIEPTSTGYSAFSPDVPGCAAVGDTQEETRRNFQDALVAHFEVMREIREPIPEPRVSVEYVEVA